MASGMLMQLSDYMDKRMSMLISSTGASAIVISTSPDDLLGTPPVGITIPANGNFLLTHVLHGELVWEQWWANCTTNVITVWTWFCTSNIPGAVVTPTKTLCEATEVNTAYGCCKPKKKQGKDPDKKCKELKKMLTDLTSNPKWLEYKFNPKRF